MDTLQTQVAAFFNQLLVTLKPLLDALHPAWEVYKPVHEQLAKPLLGPFSGYFTILMALQFIMNFYPSGSSEKVAASHILVKEEAQAKAILKELIEEETSFEDAAKKHSLCPSKKNGGSLGSFSRGQMVREFETICFDPETQLNKVYGPIKTQFGFHLIKVTSKADQDKLKKE